MNVQMEIFFATDDNFVKHLSVAMASLLYNADKEDNINIYIMTKGLLDENLQKIKTLSSIRPFYLEILTIDDSLFQSYQSPDYINSTSTFYRYLIPELKPEINKVLYLDCDIVVKQSLKELWETELGDNYIAGVEDVHESLLLTKIKPEFDSDEPYLNAGVLLFNCEQMRKDNISKQLFDKSATLNTNVYFGADQDVLNIVCKHKKMLLELKYNLLSAVFNAKQSSVYTKQSQENAIKNPVIIHFTDRQKPWMIESFPQNDFAYEYHKYLKITPFYDASFEKKLIIQNIKMSKYIKIFKENIFLQLFKGFFDFLVQIIIILITPIKGLKILNKYKKRTVL